MEEPKTGQSIIHISNNWELKPYTIKVLSVFSISVCLLQSAVITSTKWRKNCGFCSKTVSFNFAYFTYLVNKYKLTLCINKKNQILFANIRTWCVSSPPGKGFLAFPSCTPFWEVAMEEFIIPCQQISKFGVFHSNGELQRCVIPSLSCEGK